MGRIIWFISIICCCAGVVGIAVGLLNDIYWLIVIGIAMIPAGGMGVIFLWRYLGGSRVSQQASFKWRSFSTFLVIHSMVAGVFMGRLLYQFWFVRGEIAPNIIFEFCLLSIGLALLTNRKLKGLVWTGKNIAIKESNYLYHCFLFSSIFLVMYALLSVNFTLLENLVVGVYSLVFVWFCLGVFCLALGVGSFALGLAHFLLNVFPAYIVIVWQETKNL